MFSPSRSPSLVSIASSGLSPSDEDFNLDSMPLDAVVHIERPTMSEPAEDCRDLLQIKMTREDWEKLQALEQHLHDLASACSAPAAIEKHARFFLPTENVFVLVSNTLYSVPRAPFEMHSSAFTGKGLTEDDPFILADVEIAHFDLFLSILYPSEYGMYTATTVDEWTAILHLAVRWGFGSVRTLSIKHLAPIASDIDKIVLGRQYGIDPWLHEAFAAVCMRAQSLTKEEGRHMKVDDIIEISAIRQLLRPAAQPEQPPPLSIVEACAGFDIAQFISLATSSERAAPGPAIASTSNATASFASSEEHAGLSGQGLGPTLNQPDLTPPTTVIDTTAPSKPTPSEEAGAREVAALERAKREKEKEITERALRSAEKAREVATRERAERAKEIEITERALRYAEKAREDAALERAKRAKETEIHERALRSAEKAREVAALERAKDTVITERALCTFLKPSTNALLDSVGDVHKTCLRSVAKVMRAELTNTVDPHKQKVLDFIANYKAAHSPLH